MIQGIGFGRVLGSGFEEWACRNTCQSLGSGGGFLPDWKRLGWSEFRVHSANTGSHPLIGPYYSCMWQGLEPMSQNPAPSSL